MNGHDRCPRLFGVEYVKVSVLCQRLPLIDIRSLVGLTLTIFNGLDDDLLNVLGHLLRRLQLRLSRDRVLVLRQVLMTAVRSNRAFLGRIALSNSSTAGRLRVPKDRNSSQHSIVAMELAIFTVSLDVRISSRENVSVSFVYLRSVYRRRLTSNTNNDISLLVRLQRIITGLLKGSEPYRLVDLGFLFYRSFRRRFTIFNGRAFGSELSAGSGRSGTCNWSRYLLSAYVSVRGGSSVCWI